MKVFLVSWKSVIARGRPSEETKILIEALSKRGVESEVVAWEDTEVKWDESDLSVVRTAHNYFMDVPAFLKWARRVEEETTLWNTSQVIAWNSHKQYLLKLIEAGVPTPPTILVEEGSKESLSNLLRARDWDEIMIKPAVSVGAWGAARFKGTTPEAETHFQNLVVNGYSHTGRTGKIWSLPPGDTLIQPFIPEVMENGEASLMYFGGEYSHSVLKKARPGDFRVHDTYGGTVLPYEAAKSERSVAEAALGAIDLLTEYARIDVVTTSEGPVIIEMELIEPRLFFDYVPHTVDSFADYITHSFQR